MQAIEGRKILRLRPMTEAELAREGWDLDAHGVPTALELEGGIVLYASCDPEGNGPGALFGYEGETAFQLVLQ
jgi:hypothetical protein